MGRPAKAIDTNSQKMSKQERKAREETEKNSRTGTQIRCAVELF